MHAKRLGWHFEVSFIVDSLQSLQAFPCVMFSRRVKVLWTGTNEGHARELS